MRNDIFSTLAQKNKAVVNSLLMFNVDPKET